MAFTPPSSPTLNQIYSSASGQNWIWNGTQWEPFNPPLGIAPVTAGSFNAGGASTFGTNPITVSAVTCISRNVSVSKILGYVKIKLVVYIFLFSVKINFKLSRKKLFTVLFVVILLNGLPVAILKLLLSHTDVLLSVVK